jgi:hypothetical protein
MCWRDDAWIKRVCSLCGEVYFGSLGHIGCPARIRMQEEAEQRRITLEQKISSVGERHGWDTQTATEKIERTKEILVLKSIDDAIDFLLETIPKKGKDTVDKLEEDNPPF